MAANGEHHIPFATYVKVILFLLFMTVVTVWIAGYDLKPFTMFVAMFIATIKATVVAWYFMHLKFDGNENRVMILAGVFFLIVMFAFSYGDIVTRNLHQSTL